ncbi:hypothetical protein ABZ135_16920 [Streptomyces sp. NPDC006339]|uniref:8-oxoguanine DNA glycosylase OGG fold protein n=1 Tax=Streptomyces sp. NPDC006339 TaxID=3156755 RepID=UPI0033BCA68E
MGRQDDADALDAELMRRRLPPSAVEAVASWLAGPGARYVAGVGGHSVTYVPAHWTGVEPWPARLAGQKHAQVMAISRSQVVDAVRDAVGREAWSEALVAPYVWGQGRAGYGPHRLKKILAASHVGDAVAEARAALREKGAVAGYRALYGAVSGLGPAFFTKLLYFLDSLHFLDLTAGDPRSPRALILDRRVARVVRAHAQRVGRDMGLDSAADVAGWVWSDGGWTPHRYETYMGWMAAATQQLREAGIGWPPEAQADLLELALFDGVWDPAA